MTGDLLPSSHPRGGPDVGGVSGDMDAIFAACEPLPTADAAPASKVRAVSGRRTRIPYATAGAVAAAGLVGLSAGTVLVRAHSVASAAAPAAAPAPMPARALQVQVAAPPVTMPVARGPIPVLDNTPVVLPAAPHRTSARPRASDLMAADRRLRAAYFHAVRAGVPRHVLVSYRDRWEDLRHDASWRPARVAAGYGEMSVDLERLAKRSHGHRTPPRHGLFGLFS